MSALNWIVSAINVSALNWIVSAINGKFKEWEPKRIFSFLDCHESKLSLIARETVIFLFNHQFISISIRPKSISLEQSCWKRPHAVVVTSQCCLLILSQFQRPEADFEKFYQYSVRIEISLDLSLFLRSNERT